jgi:hypothetical protein
MCQYLRTQVCNGQGSCLKDFTREGMHRMKEDHEFETSLGKVIKILSQKTNYQLGTCNPSYLGV